MNDQELHDAIRAECQADPKGLGLGPLFASAQDRVVADLLNAKDGPGSGPIAVGIIPKGAFLIGIAPAALRLAGMSADLQGKWDRVIRLVTGADAVVDCGAPTIRGTLALAVSDGVLTQAEVDAFATRVGSRAEVLVGADAVISAAQVGASR